MTANSPRNGSHPRARRLLSRLAAVLVVAGIALGGSAPASAATDEPKASADEVVALGISTGSGARVEPNGPLVSTITIANSTDDALSAGSVDLEVNPTPLGDAAALDSWLDDGSAAGDFRTVATEPSPPVAAGDSIDVGSVADAAELGALAPGVYAVRARLTGATTNDPEATAWTLTATSVLVIAPANTQSVGIVVPITATPDDGVLLSADELAELTAPNGMLSGQIDAVTDTPAILAVDPAIPAAIRMLGTSAPASAIAWLQRLEQLANDKFALQLGDADPATQAHAGQKALLTAPDLTPLLQTADFPTSTPAPTAPSTTTPTPALPDNAALMAVAGSQPGILWPRGDLTSSDLATFDGYLGAPGTTIIPSTSFEGSPGAHAVVDGHSVLVTDAAASARLSTAATSTDPIATDREIAAAAGHLFFTSRTSQTVLVGLDRSQKRSPVALRDVLSAFASPAVRLATLRNSPPASATLRTTAGTVRAGALTAMLADEQRLQAFSSILDVPALMLAPERIRMLRTIAVGLSDAAFTTATTDRAKHVQDLLGAVSIQRPKPVQLIAASAPLPVWVRNDLPWNVNVSLHSTPSDPRLDIQETTEIVAGRASSTRVDVPISARVASGEVKVDFRLTSPSGVAIGSAETADVTLRADWEAIGLGILGGIIGLLFVFGLIRTVRRRRTRGSIDGTGSDERPAEEHPADDTKPDEAPTSPTKENE